MSNEAAERLRRLQIAAIDGDEAFEANDLLDAALAAERRATVERIRAAYWERRLTPKGFTRFVSEDDMTAIFDAEAQR
jgi:hypothetical protein